jgi:hypothetical protein
MVIKDFPVEKDLATQLAQANQVIASQRQEITFLSQKAHQDAIAITTEEIPIHLSFAEKKKKIVVEKKAIHQAQTPSQLIKAQPNHSSSSSPAHYSPNFSLPHKGEF